MALKKITHWNSLPHNNTVLPPPPKKKLQQFSTVSYKFVCLYKDRWTLGLITYACVLVLINKNCDRIRKVGILCPRRLLLLKLSNSQQTRTAMCSSESVSREERSYFMTVTCRQTPYLVPKNKPLWAARFWPYLKIFLMCLCFILLFLSFYFPSFSSTLYLPVPHSAIFPCPILFLLLILYIYSLFFYLFIFIYSCHFLFLIITVLLNIIICLKLFRLPLLLILCLLTPLVLLICILTRIYLHGLLLFIMFNTRVRPYYSFFVIWYTFITSPSSYSLYHDITNFIVFVSIRSSSAFINSAVCEKFALHNCVFWISTNNCYYSHVLRAQLLV